MIKQRTASAEDVDDIESPLELGRHYFNLVQTDDNLSGENSREAVRWLLEASERGSSNAVEMLKECLVKNIGINDNNIDDVKQSIETPAFEKAASHTARHLYRTLRPSGSEKLTKHEYLKSVRANFKNKKEKRLLEKAAKSIKVDECLSEEEFVSRMVRFVKGQSGINFKNVLQHDVEWEAYNSASFFQKVTKYPGKTIHWLVENVVEIFGHHGSVWLKSLIPVHQISMLLAVFFYNLISVNAVLHVVPLFCFYTSFVALVIFTMQMFYNRRRLSDVRVMTGLFSRVSKTFDRDGAESAFVWGSMAPYICYFATLLSVVFFFSAADKSWISSPALAVVCVVFAASSFFALSERYDHLTILSIVLDFISTLPAIIDGFPRIPLICHLLEVIAGGGVSIPILPGFYLQFGIPSLAFFLTPLIFVRMTMLRSWNGTYQVLVPHLVCFAWWRLVVIFLRYSTWIGLVWASILWMTLIFLAPVFGVGLVVWIVFKVVKSLSELIKFFKTTSALILAVVAVVWVKYGSRLGMSSIFKLSWKANVIIGTVLIFFFVPLSFLAGPVEERRSTVHMPLDAYYEICSAPQWSRTSQAETMTYCSHLSHIKVNWTGIVKKTAISRIENQAESFMDALTDPASKMLKCAYGSSYPSDCRTLPSERERVICETNRQQRRDCHMKDFNVYTFEISVTVATSTGAKQDVTLVAADGFREVYSTCTMETRSTSALSSRQTSVHRFPSWTSTT